MITELLKLVVGLLDVAKLAIPAFEDSKSRDLFNERLKLELEIDAEKSKWPNVDSAKLESLLHERKIFDQTIETVASQLARLLGDHPPK